MKKKIKYVRENAKEKIKSFNKELRNALSIALLGAFGFIVALAWRDVITSYVNQISQSSPLKGQIISALIITFISVIGILIVTKFISNKEKKK